MVDLLVTILMFEINRSTLTKKLFIIYYLRIKDLNSTKQFTFYSSKYDMI